MLTENGYNGAFFGRALFQAKGDTGGAKHVFVKLQGVKNELVFPTFGGRVMNPFKGAAKIFAGDLMEYRTDEDGLNPTIYLLKTYKVKSQSGTTVNLYRDRYTHIPFAGDILMKAPAAIGGTGTGGAVTAVSKGTDSGTDGQRTDPHSSKTAHGCETPAAGSPSPRGRRQCAAWCLPTCATGKWQLNSPPSKKDPLLKSFSTL